MIDQYVQYVLRGEDFRYFPAHRALDRTCFVSDVVSAAKSSTIEGARALRRLYGLDDCVICRVTTRITVEEVKL